MQRGRADGQSQSHAGTWPPRVASAVGPASASWPLWRAWLARLGEWALAEAGPGRLLPWIPIAFGCGIATYFSADHEPVAGVAASTAVVLCALAFSVRHRRVFALAALFAAAAAGFATATLRTARIAHGVLVKPAFVSVAGFIETHEVRERSDRFVLRVVRMDSPYGHAPKLERVRLSVRKGTALAVGSFVSLKARLQPPLAPLRPGSYDFARDMFFQGIGASGFVMGAVTTLRPPESGGLALRYDAVMQDLRDAIDARIRSVLSGDSRAIATALLTGRRDAISTPVNDAMFISGLGHVLSISGYHMAVVAGVVFFAVRALLALIPALTATFPIKKWSAAAALAAALFYLLLSGAEVATQRSFFMTAAVLIAVMVDRRAITFRTLAVAAMIVLALAPEALVHPSFQMSFAATLGLVALVQIGMPKLLASPDHSATARVALWGGREIMTLALASFVAGLATTPYAAFHFHRVTPYGVIANLLAMPIVSALVMPAGLLGLAAIPFGFDGVFWRLMDAGIAWMIAVAQWVAALPGAIGRVPTFGTGALIAMTIGIVLLGLLRTPLRWCGLGLIAAGIAWAIATPRPDILVAGDGHSVAVRGHDGRLHLMRAARDSFMVKEWLAADADARSATDPSLAEGVSCDEAGCVTELADGALVAMALRPEALEDDCERAAVVVTTWQAPEGCAARVIDRAELRRRGAMALRQTQGGGRHTFAVTAIRPKGVDRPWSPSPEAAHAGAPTLPQQGRRQPVEATPADADIPTADREI